MAFAFMTNAQFSVFNQIIFNFIMDLKRKHNQSALNSLNTEIIQTIEFKGTTKEHLQDRISTLIINKKIINKI